MAKKKQAPKTKPKANAKKKATTAPKKSVAPAKKKAVAPARKVAPKKAVAKKATPAKKAPVKSKKVATKKTAQETRTAKKKPASKAPVVKKATPAKVKSGAAKAASKAIAPTKKAAPATVEQAPKVTASKKAVTPAAVPKKTLKQKVQIEFNLNSSPTALFEFISTPSGFAEWYCTDVDVNDDHYVFKWEDDEEEECMLIGRMTGEMMRFHRVDDEDPDAFFEFRIRIDDMTNDVALIVTDHAWPKEMESVRNLWNTQIHELMRVLGA